MTPEVAATSSQIQAAPRVTVVMAVYNAAQYLREAVGSVLAQTYRDFELIVVDDCSTDDSRRILESFTDPRIRIIRNETNLGAALARNRALESARGELIAIMDADDVCAPIRLERQVAFLDANPAVGVVGCSVYDNIDANGGVLYTSYQPEGNGDIQKALMERWCFVHSSLLFRKSLYQVVGGYRKAFEPVEDHDFVLRLVEHCEAHSLNQRLVSYRINPNGLTVVGHRFSRQLSQAAILLAKRRRSSKPENFEAETGGLLASRRRQNGNLYRVVRNWQNSLYAAHRFYEFGSRELGLGNYEQARRCFLHSVRTNRLFVKSWVGVALSLVTTAGWGLSRS